jgi:DNA helicase-2/ATP-dependent DNA helicase PcrA
MAGKPQFSFGKTMHSTMQKFFLLARSCSQQGQQDLFGSKAAVRPIEWEDVKKIYEESFIDDWYPNLETKDKYYQKGLLSLKNFFSDWQAKPILAEDLEQGFTFKIDKDHSLRGAIDRIDKKDDGFRLVDYKTGSPKETLRAEDKEQLLIYQMAATEVLGLKVNELVFYYFDNNKELSFLGNDKEIEKLRNKISQTIDDIKKGEFPPKPSKETCKWCDFKNICDFAA